MSSSGSIVSSSSSDRDEDDRQPDPHQRLRRRSAWPAPSRRARLTKSPAEAGSIRTPVSSASRPWTICRKSGHREEDAHQDQVLGEQHRERRRAAAGSRSSARCTQRVVGRALRGGAPRPRSRPARARRRRSRTGVSEKPKGSIGELRGRSQPQLLACSTPKTTRPRPSAESTPPTQSSAGASPARSRLAGSAACRAGSRSRRRPRRRRRPASSARSSPSRRGSGRPRCRRRRRRRARRRRPRARWPSKLPATSATIAGSTSAAPMPSRTDQPSISEGTLQEAAVSAEPTRVDAEADREGAAAAPDVAELAAGQHQRRHHQRVEGDHRLDRRHGRVEVFDQLGDRDVHHRLVEDHQELRRRQDDEDSPLHGLSVWARAAAVSRRREVGRRP